MLNTKRVLHVDGEYLKNANIEITHLKDSLKRILGEAGYPNHLIYYGANSVSEKVTKELLLLDISNIVINTDGYIVTLSDGKRVQKGVDTTIVLNVLRDDSEMVYLLSGDGDMFPLAKVYKEEKKRELITLSFKKSTADGLIRHSRNFFLDKKEEKREKSFEEEIVDEVESIVYSVWLKESGNDSSKFLTGSRLGQLGSLNSNVKVNNIKKRFEELGKKDYIEVKKSDNPKNPDTLIRFLKPPLSLSKLNFVPETKDLLRGGEEIVGDRILGEIIDSFTKGSHQYFFVKSGTRVEDIYLNIKELSLEEKDIVTIGSKISFDLKRGSGKNDIAINVKLLSDI